MNHFGCAEEFRKKFTSDMYEQLLGFARRGAFLVVGHGSRPHAEDLVHDAICDTLSGRFCWTPSASSLRTHLFNAVSSRAARASEHRARFAHVGFDLHDEDGEHHELEVEIYGLMHDEQERARERWSERYEALRRRFAGDADVIRLFDLRLQGIERKAKVLAETGWTENRYRNTRDRLSVLAAQSRETSSQ